jgi:hypothetical protein
VGNNNAPFGQNYCEWLEGKIPHGDGCSDGEKSCEYWVDGGTHCMLFDEPCHGAKVCWCKNNKWLSEVRYAKGKK